MDSYAHLSFLRHPVYKTQYILCKQEGEVSGLKLAEYKPSNQNDELHITGKKFIVFEVPRNPSIRKYFAHTFTMANKEVLTSTEKLNECNRTFGDTKKLGTTDLILIQFSENMSELDMYFVKDRGNSKSEKQAAFDSWNKELSK